MGEEGKIGVSKIEALINFKLALINKRPKAEVTKKFIIYSDKYEELGGSKSVIDKSEYRDIKHDFARYISSSKEDEMGREIE